MTMTNKKKINRSAQGGGTIRKRTDREGWEGRYTIGRDPGTGKQIQKSVYGKTQAEVRKKLAQIVTDIDNDVYTEPAKLTVGGWLDIWLKDYIGNVKPPTRRSYVDNVNNHIKPALGAVPLRKLSAHMVQGFYNDLLEGGRIMQKGQTKEKPAGLSPKTVKNIHGALHRALNQAVLLGYIKANPTDATVLPRIEKKEMLVLQGEEVPAFMKAAESHYHGILFTVTLFTGLRRGEVLGIEWNRVDFANGTIFINKQLQREEREDGTTGDLVLVPLKNDRVRTLTPPSTVFALLERQRRRQNEKKLKAGALWGDSGLVFTNELGGPLDADAVYDSYKRFLEANGLPDIRLHDLRHTAATLMLQNGVSIKTVQETLGHATAAFTLDVYGHVTEQMKREAADKMEGYIQSLKNKTG
jgi:integrase